MRTCQLGKGRNCREGGTHKQGDWRLFEQPETVYACAGLFAGQAHSDRIPAAFEETCGSGLAP